MIYVHWLNLRNSDHFAVKCDIPEFLSSFYIAELVEKIDPKRQVSWFNFLIFWLI